MGAAVSRLPAAQRRLGEEAAPVEIPRGLKAFLKAVPTSSCDQLMAVVARRRDYLSRTGPALGGGGTALHAAAKAGRADVMTAFLLHLSGEDVSTNDRSVQAGRRASVSGSIPFAPLPPHSPDKPNALSAALNLRSVAGFTPLMAAAAAGAVECVRVLVTMGCDIRAVDCPGGRTALHVAARAGHVQIAEFLLQADRVQSPAAMAAAAAVRAPPPPRLVHLRTVCEVLALHYAAAHGKADAVSLLLRHGSNATAALSEGQYDIENSAPGITALHLAAQRGDLEVVRLILFHYVARSRPDLADCGPDPRFVKTLAGHRPYNLAVRNRVREPELLRLLDPDSDLTALLPDAVQAARAARAAERNPVQPLRRIAAAALAAALECSVQVAAAATMAAVAGGPVVVESFSLRQPGTPGRRPSALASADVSTRGMVVVSPRGVQGGSPRGAPDASVRGGGDPSSRGVRDGSVRAGGVLVSAASGVSGVSSAAAWCGVCLGDAEGEQQRNGACVATVRMGGCGHTMCSTCASKLASLVTRSAAPMRCPFCRSTVAGFLPAIVL